MGHITVSRVRARRLVKKTALIMLGAAIFTFGVHNIHEVTGITEGGVIGLMLFLNRWFGIPSSIGSPILDILCYAIALKVLGGSFLGWSAVATVAVAMFYGVWEHVPYLLPDLSGDPRWPGARRRARGHRRWHRRAPGRQRGWRRRARALDLQGHGLAGCALLPLHGYHRPRPIPT